MKYLISKITFLVYLCNVLNIQSQDLKVNALSTVASPISIGSNPVISVETQNVGSLATAATTGGIYLSQDSILTPADLSLGSIALPILQAGVVQNSSATVALPSTQATGTYYIFVYADPNGVLQEERENNNSKFIKVLLVNGILDVAVSLPPSENNSLHVGEWLQMPFNLLNKDITILTNCEVGFFLSQDSVLSNIDTLLSVYTANGPETKLSTAIWIPAYTKPGAYYIIAVADYTKNFKEIDESNNIAFKKIFLEKKDYLGLPYATSISLKTCDTTLYDLGGPNSNYGPNTHGSITLYPNKAGSYIAIEVLDLKLGGNSSFGVYDGPYPYNESYVFYPNSALPTDTLFSTNTQGSLTIGLNSQGVTERGFKAKVSCVSNFAKPDLVIKSLLSRVTTLGYGISFELANTGRVPSRNTKYRIIFSVDSIWSGDDQVLATENLAPLAVGANLTSNYSVSIPYIKKGNYYLIMQVNGDNNFAEESMQNNIKPLKIAIAEDLHDFQVSNFNANFTAIAAGTNFTSNFVINNLLNSKYNNIGYRIFASQDTTFDVADALLYQSGTYTYYNKNVTVSSTLSIPLDFKPGNYYLFLMVNADDKIDEKVKTNNFMRLPITVINSNIDLTFTYLSLPKTTILSNESLTVSTIESNLSINPSPAHKTACYLSKDSLFDAMDVMLQSIKIFPISGNSTTYPVFTANMPALTPGGDYYLIVVADVDKEIDEINEANNMRFKPIKVLDPKPDLRIKLILLDAYTVIQDNYVNFYYAEENIGSTYVEKNKIAYYLSKDTILSNNDIFMKHDSATAIYTPGSSNTFSKQVNFSIPKSVPVGLYYLIVVADYNNMVAETNETNNILVSKNIITVVSGTIDVEVANTKMDYGSADTTIYTGSPYSVESRYKGNGTYSGNYATYNLGFYLSKDTSFTSDDVLLSPYDSLRLTYSSSSSASVKRVTLPHNIASGAYYILVVADPLNRWAEFNETNNIKYARVKVVQSQGDLYITNFTIPKNNYSTIESITVNSTIRNKGRKAITTSSTTAYLFSKDSLLSADDIMLKRSSLGSVDLISPLGSSQSLQIPVQTPAGTYFILMVLDYLDFVNESDKSNNVSAVKFKVDNYANDLSIGAFTVNSNSFSAGAIVNASLSVNYATTSVPVHAQAFYLSTDSIYSIGDTYLGSNDVATVASIPMVFSKALSIPKGIALGTYYLIAIADYNKTIPETNETNNNKTLQVSIKNPGPDLTISKVTALGSYYIAASTLTAIVNVSNIGVVDAGMSETSFYVSTDSVWSVNDVGIGAYSTNNLYAGASADINISATIPANLSTGDYYIIAKVDNKQVVAETNENNNHKTFKIYVTGRTVDLRITRFNIGGMIQPIYNLQRGSTISVYVDLSNTGNASVTTGIDFYLSTDSTSSYGSSLSSSANSVTIGAGQTISTSYMLTVNSSTPYLIINPINPQLYYLIARIDPQNLIAETSESNNKRLSGRPDQINIVANADISLDALTLKNATVEAGNYAKAILTANNAGMDPMPNNVDYMISKDSLGQNVVAMLDTKGIYVNGREQKMFDHNVYIPSKVPAGNYYLFARTYSFETSYYDPTWFNNTKATKITITASNLDLSIRQLSVVNAVLSANSYATVTSTDETSGTGFAQQYQVSYYLSSDTVFSANIDQFMGSYFAYNNESQPVITYSNNVYIPNVKNGGYYIIVVINSNNEVVENNKANNTKYIPITIGVVTDIDSQDFMSSINLYPNPSTGMVYLQNTSYEEISVEVFNTSNQLVFEEAKVGDHLALEHLPEGLYLVKLKSGDGKVQSRKIVITK